MKKLLNEWKKHLKEINEGVDPTCPDNVVEHAEDIFMLLDDAGHVEWSKENEADFLGKFGAFIEEYKEEYARKAAAAKKAAEDSREDF